MRINSAPARPGLVLHRVSSPLIGSRHGAGLGIAYGRRNVWRQPKKSEAKARASEPPFVAVVVSPQFVKVSGAVRGRGGSPATQ